MYGVFTMSKGKVKQTTQKGVASCVRGIDGPGQKPLLSNGKKTSVVWVRKGTGVGDRLIFRKNATRISDGMTSLCGL